MIKYMVIHSRDGLGHDLYYCEVNKQYYKWLETFWSKHGNDGFNESIEYWREYKYSFVTEKYMKLRGKLWP